MPDPMTALLIGLLFLAVLTLLFWPNGGLVGHLQRVSQHSARIRREDALKHLYNTERQGGQATLESLAGALDANIRQATAVLTELQSQELVNLDNHVFRLSSTGREYALRIIRAHRIWERYLAEETGFRETEWHDIAERYEHRLSPEAVEALSAQLGHPTYDPHGDPIPTADGEIIIHNGRPLADMPLDTPLRIVHMEDEPKAVYAQLIAEGLYPGIEISLTEITPQQVRFWAESDEHILAPIVAANITVAPIPQEDYELPCFGQPLDILEPGQKGEVISLSPRLRGADRRRMMDLGILPGTIIQAEMLSPGGDPTAYRIRGALIALRREQAQLICINPQPEAVQ
ncbi:MAG: metal-dependent transcriptional regulator [Anaerolineales bacterium]|nr:metal-dependent transcriptional regulator [Anaerolineales bacterium]